MSLSKRRDGPLFRMIFQVGGANPVQVKLGMEKAKLCTT